MKFKVVAPSVGESITEVSILKWAKQNGQAVKAGDLLLEIESDKATVEVVAENPGVLEIAKPAGERIPIGAVIGYIDDAATPTIAASAAAPAPTATAAKPAPAATSPASPAAAPPTAAPNSGGPGAWGTMGPAAKKTAMEKGIDPSQINGSGKDGRVTKGDVIQFKAPAHSSAPTPTPTPVSKPAAPGYQDQPGDRRVPMSMLRARIAERLVQAQHTAAILTTFNECDMSAVMKERNQFKDAFKAKHGVPLSFMSYFAFACIEALKAVPEVNGKIDGRDMIYSDYYDLGIAVGTERGLVVPVIRGADKLTVPDLEKKLAEMATRARNNKLSIAELTGGTFTISNGGTYGSLMSTPILNAPQSGILGMHKIMDRPMVMDGKIEIRPMMYLALSYDHRIVDGKGAVTFLVKVKECIENPALMKMNLGL